MRKFGRNIVLILAAVYISITNGEIGAKCTNSLNCPGDESCVDHHCHCSDIEYSKSLYPVCSHWRSHNLCGSLDDCGRNSKCINFQCMCDEGYYRIDSSCRKGQLQPVMGICREEGQAVWLCDVSKHSVCISNICVCSKGYVPTSDGLCKPQESYMKNYSLSEYHVKPGEYCRDSANCIEGLACEGFKCRCPTTCRYDQRKEVCDCGEVESQTQGNDETVFVSPSR
ncbi:tenascin-like isoform X3 [Penaeus chinensis]|uniref:tenascin-like isoform X3 n=1 Tax=Penaeus chinensis TaxID=139456 RepID=UPI001FB644FB|nr:tenascin-like isoform X3 [Penaeus chinensis]XP_047485212.1 tenascin-like isoform X3 [Penaeus chinensis]